MLPSLDHKFEFRNQIIKIESHTEDSGKTAVFKKNQSNEKSNAENLIGNHSTNKPPSIKSSNHVNNILFEKNHIETTNRIKTSPIQVKKKLNLEEYLKRRPDLKLNPSKSYEIKQEINKTIDNSNQLKAEQEHTVNTIQGLYEEIIVVSMGTNTDVTIPSNDDTMPGDLRSIKLISNITDTIAKVSNVGEHISSNSLIASIRDVIIKKSNSLNCSNNVPENSSEIEKELEHGEDKTIMHLKKDRIRVKRTSIAVQTDCNIRFPTLELLEKSKINCYAKSLSRSRSTSSKSSYSSFASERRKSKIVIKLWVLIYDFVAVLGKRSKSPMRSTIARGNYSWNGSKQGFEKSYKRSRQEKTGELI